jgi:hypothetical protein
VKNDLILYFCAHENIGRIIFFFKIKFIIRLSNNCVLIMLVHFIFEMSDFEQATN